MRDIMKAGYPISHPLHPLNVNTAMMNRAAARRRREEREHKEQQERQRCESVDASFDARSAAVEAKQDYAHCVNILYPPQGGGGAISLWAIVPLMLLVLIVTKLAVDKA